MFSRFLRSEDGAAFIEFAVAVPLLVLLLVGTIETGRYMAYAVRLGNAAHAGVQFAAMNYATGAHAADIADAACNDSQFSCTTATPSPGHTASPDTMYISSQMTCSVRTTPCPDADMYARVTASGTFRPLLQYPIFSNAVPMSAQATQQVNP